MSDIPSSAYVDSGPVLNAVATLIAQSSLGDHVAIEPRSPGDSVRQVYHLDDDVPYSQWGSGAQGLWLLLLSFAHGHQVSLYDIIGRLDQGNRRAVVLAMEAFCA